MVEENSEQRERYVAAIAALVETLTERERVNLFSRYCKECGANDPRCQCWNDE